MAWLFEGEAGPRADCYRCDHAEATVTWSDAGYPLGHCPCCRTSWRRDLMMVPDVRSMVRRVFLKPIPTFVPVDLAAPWVE